MTNSIPTSESLKSRELHDTKRNLLENRKVDLRKFRKVGKEKRKKMTNIQIATAEAFHYRGRPYIWMGDGSAKYWGGVDCSGFVQLVLDVVGLDPKGDQTAQALFNAYKVKKTDARLEGCLLFFGKSTSDIHHVAYCLSPAYMIEAGGGNSKCTTVAIANEMNACVKVSKISRRSDLVAVVNPFG